MPDKPLKPKHRRLALHDPRLLPAAARKRAPASRKAKTARARVRGEGGRLFAGTLRTSDPALRALLPDEAQLRRLGLPLWRTEEDLARALRISVKELRYYSLHRRADR